MWCFILNCWHCDHYRYPCISISINVSVYSVNKRAQKKKTLLCPSWLFDSQPEKWVPLRTNCDLNSIYLSIWTLRRGEFSRGALPLRLEFPSKKQQPRGVFIHPLSSIQNALLPLSHVSLPAFLGKLKPCHNRLRCRG